VRTYGIDATIVRGANAYGPNQFPEKFIPVLAINTLEGRPLPVYGDGQQVREFTYVTDFAAGIDTVLRHGRTGEAYNCGSEQAQVNLDTARRVVAILAADEELIQHVADRPGHDRRYAIDCAKLRGLGWAPQVEFADGLRETVEWYRANEAWWRAIQAGSDYTDYVAANYGGRAGA
jgi:dTDP-glucose 4,6-dehydratase